jgi:hypothetical protein
MAGAGRQASCIGRLHNRWKRKERDERFADEEWVRLCFFMRFIVSVSLFLEVVWVWSAPKNCLSLKGPLCWQGLLVVISETSECKLYLGAGLVPLLYCLLIL